MDTRVVRIKELSERLGVARSTIWRMQRTGRLPKHHRFSANVVGWLESELNEWWRSNTDSDGEGGEPIGGKEK